MPTRNPKPKEKRRIKIPYELQDGMRELFQRIEDAKHDQDEDFSYDDALQAPGITGGKIGESRWPYVFSFFPSEGPKNSRWHLPLHVTEIEDIGDRVMTEISLFCCGDSDCGFKTRDDAELCGKCDYAN